MACYKHILVATDLSKGRNRVLEQAHALAKQNKAKLSIIYIMKHSAEAYGGEFSIPMDVNLEEKLESRDLKKLKKIAAEFDIAEKNIYFFDKGRVKKEVIRMAIELKIDLIVIGIHAHHGLDALFPSRATAILHQASCDVLAVRLPNE